MKNNKKYYMQCVSQAVQQTCSWIHISSSTTYDVMNITLRFFLYNDNFLYYNNYYSIYTCSAQRKLSYNILKGIFNDRRLNFSFQPHMYMFLKGGVQGIIVCLTLHGDYFRSFNYACQFEWFNFGSFFFLLQSLKKSENKFEVISLTC